MLLPVSETYMYPPASTLTPNGRSSIADVAWPPSPTVPWAPVPATTAIAPVVRVRRYTLWVDAPPVKKTFPDASAKREVRVIAAWAAVRRVVTMHR